MECLRCNSESHQWTCIGGGGRRYEDAAVSSVVGDEPDGVATELHNNITSYGTMSTVYMLDKKCND